MPEAIERAVDALPLTSPDASPDAVIRIGLPYDLAPAGRICTLVMATVEAGLLSPNRIHGGVPLHRALQGSDVLLFTPSAWAYEGLLFSGAPPARVHVVPPGVHPAFSSPPPPPDRGGARQRPA